MVEWGSTGGRFVSVLVRMTLVHSDQVWSWSSIWVVESFTNKTLTKNTNQQSVVIIPILKLTPLVFHQSNTPDLGILWVFDCVDRGRKVTTPEFRIRTFFLVVSCLSKSSVYTKTSDTEPRKDRIVTVWTQTN